MSNSEGEELEIVEENTGTGKVSDMGDADKVIKFCLENKIDKPVIDEVLSRGYTSLEALRLLDISDLQSPKIPRGQRRLLIHVARSLSTDSSLNLPPSESPQGQINNPLEVPPSAEGGTNTLAAPTAPAIPPHPIGQLNSANVHVPGSSTTPMAGLSGHLVDDPTTQPPPQSTTQQQSVYNQALVNTLIAQQQQLAQMAGTTTQQQFQPGAFAMPTTQPTWNDPQIHLASATDSRNGSASDQTMPEPSTLDDEVNFYRTNAFAASTSRTYSVHQLAYLDFCTKSGIPPVPISQADLGRYIAYLSRRLAFNSIRQYLNIVRLLHLENGHPNPLSNNWYISSILKGVRRVKGDSCNQKLPITLEMLQNMFLKLDMSTPFDRAFWTAFLVAFFSFFRKSNLLIPSSSSFDPSCHLCVKDAEFTPDGVILSIRWSKVIQFRERTLQIPLPKIDNYPFCPSTALLSLVSAIPPTTEPLPLFCFVANNKVLPMTQALFLQKLQGCLAMLGIPPGKYSGHSFRRGGASFGLQCGLPIDLIKIQGDWNSNAVERYLHPSLNLRRQVAQTLGKATSDRFPFSC